MSFLHQIVGVRVKHWYENRQVGTGTASVRCTLMKRLLSDQTWQYTTYVTYLGGRTFALNDDPHPPAIGTGNGARRSKRLHQ